jgi:hypothetical protein
MQHPLAQGRQRHQLEPANAIAAPIDSRAEPLAFNFEPAARFRVSGLGKSGQALESVHGQIGAGASLTVERL